MRLTAHLFNPQQGHSAFSSLWPAIKPHLIAGHRLRVTVEQETRSLDQNAKLHATLGEIARAVEWGGRKWDTEDWKRLLTAAWLRTKKEAPVMLPAVDGAGFDVLYRRTSQLTKAECSDLLEYVIAWAADKGLVLDAADQNATQSGTAR